MKRVPHPIFLKSVFSLIGLITIGITFYIRAGLNKNEIQKITGRITYLEKTFGSNPPARLEGKCRYIRLDTYAEVFEIFIGKDRGDFTPDLEKIDSLRAGDEITVYVNDPDSAQRSDVNRGVRFIDKGNEPVFIKGDWMKGMAIAIVGLSVGILALVFILKKKGKIS